MSVIAIVSGIYCSGETVAKRVAERLDYDYADEKLLAGLAEKLKVPAEKLTHALAVLPPMPSDLLSKRATSLIHVKAAIAELVSRDNTVYMGPATHLIPAEITHVLRSCLVGDRDYRIARAAEKDAIGPEEAADRIDRADRAFGDWTYRMKGRSPWAPELYDVKIPMRLGHQAPAVDIICEAVTNMVLRPTGRSVQAALDFLVATRVNLSLLAHGHPDCEVTSNNGAVRVVILQRPAAADADRRSVTATHIACLKDEVGEIVSLVDGVNAVQISTGTWPKRTSRTLLVDDEREYVFALSKRLQVRDIVADVAFDGSQALDAVEAEAPDVMVLDLKMPGIDGLEVLRRVRRNHPHIQVIVVTGHGSAEDERTARELGAFEYLEKPVDIYVLSETIRRASGQRHL